MIPAPRKKYRIILLPSGRGILLHRVSGGVVGFCGRTDIWGGIQPDCTRHYQVSGGLLYKVVRDWSSGLAVRNG